MFCASPRASSRSAASRATMASLRSISWTTSASVIQIASALMSYLERGQHLLGEQFLEREFPVTHALFESEIDEGLERLAVLLQPVGPEVLAEQRLHALGVGREPGKRGVRCGDIGEPLDRTALRLVEGLVEIHREPGMARKDVGPDHDHVHDGENTGFPEVGCFDRLVVGKETPDS